jgi:hypothetical protein
MDPVEDEWGDSVIRWTTPPSRWKAAVLYLGDDGRYVVGVD